MRKPRGRWLGENLSIVINTNEDIESLRKKLKGYEGKIFTIDASRISIECLKANFPNTAMLAAVVHVTGIMSKKELVSNMSDAFKHKFAKKPEVIEPNMNALIRGYDELRGDVDE